VNGWLWALVGLCAFVTWLVALLAFVAWVVNRLTPEIVIATGEQEQALERLAGEVREELLRESRRTGPWPVEEEAEPARPRGREDWDGPS
jgi:hypothetical protein